MLKNLNTVFLGHNFIELSETESTNSVLSELLTDSVPEGTVVVTDYQTAGRGQRGSVWYSERGKNLMMSMLFYPSSLKVEEMFYLSKLSAVALRETLQFFIPDFPIYVKWPNDVLVDKKKIAGILIENQLEEGHIKSSIIGMGINVNQWAFPDNILRSITSMSLLTGKTHLLHEVLAKLLERIEFYYSMVQKRKFELIDSEYLKFLWGYQEVVSVEVENRREEAYIIGVEKNGLLSAVINNRIRSFDIKEIKFYMDT